LAKKEKEDLKQKIMSNKNLKSALEDAIHNDDNDS